MSQCPLNSAGEVISFVKYSLHKLRVNLIRRWPIADIAQMQLSLKQSHREPSGMVFVLSADCL